MLMRTRFIGKPPALHKAANGMSQLMKKYGSRFKEQNLELLTQQQRRKRVELDEWSSNTKCNDDL